MSVRLHYCGDDAFPPAAGGKPVLLVVVDTEEEFDWTQPFDRNSRGVTSVFGNQRAHEIFDRYGVRPTYCVDQCIAEDADAVNFLSSLAAEDKCQIGTHLHPWVTPPYDEVVNTENSYHGNLPKTLEQAKIETVTDTIERAFGRRPHIFKAGRYGIGLNTIELLKEAGYTIDCSFVPHTSFHGDGGPSFVGLQDQPFWLDGERNLLEVPLTKGFSGGLAASLGPTLAPLFDADWATNFRVPGVLSRLGLLERVTLSPEGMTTSEQTRLLQSMVVQGKRVFSLTYHSSSLTPGHTPYVSTESELNEFLSRIDLVLKFFRDELGGVFTTLDDVRADALKLVEPDSDVQGEMQQSAS